MKYLFLSTLILLSVGAYAQHSDHSEGDSEGEDHHCLFKRNSLAIGAGLPYSFVINGAGINTRLYYNIGEHICFGPEFSFFKTVDLQISDFNFIGHYIFETKLFGLYPLAGVNYTIEKDPHESEEAFGVVLGGGLHRNFGLFTVFAEYSHVQSHLRDDFLTIGTLFSIR
jgi:hypothetical protein